MVYLVKLLKYCPHVFEMLNRIVLRKSVHTENTEIGKVREINLYNDYLKS